MKGTVTYERLYKRARSFRRRERIVSLLLVIVLAALYPLYISVLDEYEQAQPRHIVDAQVAAFAEGNYWTMLQAAGTGDYADVTRTELMEFLSVALDGCGFSAVAMPYSSGPEREYLILADGRKVADMVLRQQQEPSRFGFTLWEIKSVTPVSTLKIVTYAVTAPDNATVLFNGAPLGAEYITSASESHHAPHLIPGVSAPGEAVYTVSASGGTPVIAVLGANGEELPVSSDGADYAAETVYEAIPADREEVAVRALTTLIGFIQGTVNADQAYRCAERNSAAWAYLYEYSKWISASAAPRFENTRCVEYVALSPDTFCCRVQSDCYCSYSSVDDTYNPLDYRMYFHFAGDQWLLYDFTIVE